MLYDYIEFFPAENNTFFKVEKTAALIGLLVFKAQIGPAAGAVFARGEARLLAGYGLSCTEALFSCRAKQKAE
ncbi:UNVERIFIED_CONTAM: hypothetical protein K2H54_003380 [Gekko kuhli]